MYIYGIRNLSRMDLEVSSFCVHQLITFYFIHHHSSHSIEHSSAFESEIMVDDVKAKYDSPDGGKSIAYAEPSSCDPNIGCQEPIRGKVYRCRFIGIAHLALLNIIVSWGVSCWLSAMFKQRI